MGGLDTISSASTGTATPRQGVFSSMGASLMRAGSGIFTPRGGAASGQNTPRGGSMTPRGGSMTPRGGWPGTPRPGSLSHPNAFGGNRSQQAPPKSGMLRLPLCSSSGFNFYGVLARAWRTEPRVFGKIEEQAAEEQEEQEEWDLLRKKLRLRIVGKIDAGDKAEEFLDFVMPKRRGATDPVPEIQSRISPEHNLLLFDERLGVIDRKEVPVRDRADLVRHTMEGCDRVIEQYRHVLDQCYPAFLTTTPTYVIFHAVMDKIRLEDDPKSEPTEKGIAEQYAKELKGSDIYVCEGFFCTKLPDFGQEANSPRTSPRPGTAKGSKNREHLFDVNPLKKPVLRLIYGQIDLQRDVAEYWWKDKIMELTQGLTRRDVDFCERVTGRARTKKAEGSQKGSQAPTPGGSSGAVAGLKQAMAKKIAENRAEKMLKSVEEEAAGGGKLQPDTTAPAVAAEEEPAAAEETPKKMGGLMGKLGKMSLVDKLRATVKKALAERSLTFRFPAFPRTNADGDLRTMTEFTMRQAGENGDAGLLEVIAEYT
eukprot:g10879.t1